jgi:hypothetical protein
MAWFALAITVFLAFRVAAAQTVKRHASFAYGAFIRLMGDYWRP